MELRAAHGRDPESLGARRPGAQNLDSRAAGDAGDRPAGGARLAKGSADGCDRSALRVWSMRSRMHGWMLSLSRSAGEHLSGPLWRVLAYEGRTKRTGRFLRRIRVSSDPESGPGDESATLLGRRTSTRAVGELEGFVWFRRVGWWLFRCCAGQARVSRVCCSIWMMPSALAQFAAWRR